MVAELEMVVVRDRMGVTTDGVWFPLERMKIFFWTYVGSIAL